MRCATAALMLAQALSAISLGAQVTLDQMTSPHSHPAVASEAYSDSLVEFAINARLGTEVFRDQSAAIDGGYKRIGMDFPSMGEHWVNTWVLYEGHFDVTRPAMLSYATIEGKPVLTGLVYALLLRPGEQPPSVPGGGGVWHDHSGTLSDESALPTHHGGMSDTSATRLVVLHAWVGVPNPAGLFEADNWALPYLRAGVRVPNPLSISAARALSLLTGAKEYYVALAEAEGATRSAVVPALDWCANVAAPIAARMRVNGRSSPADLAALEDAWRSAMQRIAAASGASVAARLNGGKVPASD
ncbi:MAG: hypothetical protein M3Z54_08230 [Gemmatimonadota bacterium]|nr:hypothetical protein [Gemmatimonadota bacterium]